MVVVILSLSLMQSAWHWYLLPMIMRAVRPLFRCHYFDVAETNGRPGQRQLATSRDPFDGGCHRWLDSSQQLQGRPQPGLGGA